MGELGRFLEVVYGPREPFVTVRATIRHWVDRELAGRATGGGRTPMGRRRAGVPRQPREARESRLSIWHSRPGRYRVEERDGSESEPSLVVVDGVRWWSRDTLGHVEVGEPEGEAGRRRRIPSLTDLERHFDHAS